MNTLLNQMVSSCLSAAIYYGLSTAVFASTDPVAPTSVAAQASCPSLLNYRFARLQDESAYNLCQNAGKVVLVVNTASYCGYTPQYEGLEKLHAKYSKQGLVIVGFPSNDFGAQEPGSSKQIGELCFNTYGVKFDMMGKTIVKGAQAVPLYQRLAQATGKAPGWNFHKYLIGRDGSSVSSFDSDVAPQSAQLTAAIEKALAAQPKSK